MIFLAWLATIGAQIFTHVAYSPENPAVSAVPSQTMLTLGVFAITAFLDYKMHNTPEETPVDYYLEGSKETNPWKDESQQPIPEMPSHGLGSDEPNN